MDQTKEIDIDLKKIFFMMRKKVVYILLFTLLGGIAAGCFTEFFIDQKYTAKISLYVYSDMDQLSTQSSISYNDYTASTALVKSYLAVLESDAVLDKVAEKVGLTDGSTIKSSITTSQDEDTNVFYVSVTTTNPKTSQSIANAVAEVAPGEIARIIKAGGANVIDYAKEPKTPSSPNIKRNIFLGLLIAFAVSFVYFFVREAFNATITSVKDLEREFQIPVLGTIPRLVATRAGLLHDIGKALDHEMEGSHIALGVEFARKYKESEAVVHAIEAHHGDVECKTVVACLVQAADAVSASRPGARRENVENYIKRLQQLEEISCSFEGVERAYAIQAGREVRVMVKPEVVSDSRMPFVAHEIAKKIESEMEYPGQIKVNIIRESRASDVAK